MADPLPSQFARDMARRRFLLGMAGGIGSLALAGCGSRADAQAAGDSNCRASPWETDGPFPADGRGGRDRRINVLSSRDVVRRDIRPCFAGMEGEAEGVLLELELQLVEARFDCSMPLAGHAIYLWQNDAAGDYSLYNRRDVNYLRGLQVSDSEGMVRFTSILPGCYGGRSPHCHFEVFASEEAALSGEESLLTSQFAFPEEACRAVYESDARYGDSLANLERWPIARDFVFRDGDAEVRAMQVLALSDNGANGYFGTGRIALSL
ncbi:intradiol ring-cleavage dioxygenase [Alteraurantiacibacter aquimixticola]|nr:intradiol ring-cleavage dioxygenase [Alteraurantiacibacter aquimixticola]